MCYKREIPEALDGLYRRKIHIVVNGDDGGLSEKISFSGYLYG